MGVEVRKQPQVVRGSQGERVPFQFVAPPDTGTRKQWNNNEYPPLLWVFQGQIGRQKGGRAVQHPCGIGAKCLCSIWKYQRVIFWGSNTEVLRTYQERPTVAWLLRGFAPLIRHVVKGVVTSGYSRRKREYLNVPGTTAKTSIYGTLTPQPCNVSLQQKNPEIRPILSPEIRRVRRGRLRLYCHEFLRVKPA